LIERKRGNLSSLQFVEVMFVEFGEKLRELRIQHNISQSQLAEKLKVTPRTVRGREHEGRIPKQDWIYYSLSVLFACPVDVVMPEKQDPRILRCPQRLQQTSMQRNPSPQPK